MRLPARLGQIKLELSGRRSHQMVGHIRDQIEHARSAATLALSAIQVDADATAIGGSIEEVEQRGDHARAMLVSELDAAIATPIDREDLFRLSRSIDDVLNNLRDFVVEVRLFQVTDPGAFGRLLDAVSESLDRLEYAVDQLIEGRGELPQLSLRAKKASNEVRRQYQAALADLFKGPVDVEVLKRRELLRRLDVVGLRCGEAADALADGAMKRSH